MTSEEEKREVSTRETHFGEVQGEDWCEPNLSCLPFSELEGKGGALAFTCLFFFLFLEVLDFFLSILLEFKPPSLPYCN